MILTQSVTKLLFMAHPWKTTRKAAGSAVGRLLLAELASSLTAMSTGKSPTHLHFLAPAYPWCPTI